jgi:hypothetical protein
MSKGMKISPGSYLGESMGKHVSCYNDVQYGLSSMESPDNPSRIIKGSDGITLSGIKR